MIINVVNAYLRGDINLFDIGADYLHDQQVGIENTVKDLGVGLWQLSPFSKVSNEDVYTLGYNTEGHCSLFPKLWLQLMYVQNFRE